MKQNLLQLKFISEALQTEWVLIVLLLFVGCLFVYLTFLRGIAAHRHVTLRRLLKNALGHILFFIALFSIHTLSSPFAEQNIFIEKASIYIGVLALIWSGVSFVKLCRIIAFEYLFLKHGKLPVPLLIVNFVSLLVSVGLVFWAAGEIFQIKLGPLLATSAMFSVVLGLALQETLTNLFAGVSLQLDKPYVLDDWIEVHSGGQKWVGKVHEVSWRATILLGLGDEMITIPNRVIAQSQIINFSTKSKPFLRNQTFRLENISDIKKIEAPLLAKISKITGIEHAPAPALFLMESGESWLLVKLFYFISDYGNQYSIADRVLRTSIDLIESTQIKLANPKMEITKSAASAQL